MNEIKKTKPWAVLIFESIISCKDECQLLTCFNMIEKLKEGEHSYCVDSLLELCKAQRDKFKPTIKKQS